MRVISCEQRACKPMTEVAHSGEVRSRAAQDASAADNGLGTVEVSSPSSVTVVGLESD